MSILPDADWSNVANFIGGKVSRRVNTVNSFLDKVSQIRNNVLNDPLGTSPASPVRKQGKIFSRENVYSLVGSRPDPITNFDWLAIVENKGFAGSQAIPWHYIDEVTTPGMNISEFSKFRAGRNLKFADLFSTDTCSIKIYNDNKGLGFNFCNDWVRSVYRDDDFYQVPDRYKKNIKIWILDVVRKVVTDVQLIGCWPTAWTGLTLTSGSSAMLEINLTLAVDDIRFNYNSSFEAVVAGIEGIGPTRPQQSDINGNAWAAVASVAGISPLIY